VPATLPLSATPAGWPQLMLCIAWATGVAATLHELERNGGAVERDEGPAFPMTILVDCASDELLASARFAHDQDGGIAVGQQPDCLLYQTHRVA
jgi:hypothetical protein